MFVLRSNEEDKKDTHVTGSVVPLGAPRSLHTRLRKIHLANEVFHCPTCDMKSTVKTSVYRHFRSGLGVGYEMSQVMRWCEGMRWC